MSARVQLDDRVLNRLAECAALWTGFSRDAILPDAIRRAARSLGADPEELRGLVLALIDMRPERRQLPNDPEVVAVLGRAVDLALAEGADRVGLEHLRKALEAT